MSESRGSVGTVSAWALAQQMPHFTCFISGITHPAVVNITSQQQRQSYPLCCLGWSLLWICGGLWEWSRGLLLSIDFFSLKCTAGTSASIEKELHSLTQILQVRNHPDWNMDQRQSCQTGWVRLVSVVEGKRFIPPDGLDAHHIFTKCVCVRNRKYVKFLIYIPVFILNNTSFWSAATGYAFLQNKSMDILEELKHFSTERLSGLLQDCMVDVQIKRGRFKTNCEFICVIAGINVYERSWLH